MASLLDSVAPLWHQMMADMDGIGVAPYLVLEGLQYVPKEGDDLKDLEVDLVVSHTQMEVVESNVD